MEIEVRENARTARVVPTIDWTIGSLEKPDRCVRAGPYRENGEASAADVASAGLVRTEANSRIERWWEEVRVGVVVYVDAVKRG